MGFRAWTGAAVLLAGLAGAVTAQQATSPEPAPDAAAEAAARDPADRASRLIFLAADPAEGLPGPVAPELSVLALPDLPAPDEASLDVLAALLRSNPVSTFVSTPDQTHAETGDFYLVADLVLSAGAEQGPQVAVGGDAVPMADLADRLGGLVDAFAPDRRQIGFFRIDDPESVFPAALPGLRGAIGRAGFAMSVLMVGDGACDGGRNPLHYAVLAGVPDRAPFGNDDGAVSTDEVMDWLGAALQRQSRRGAACAAEYSLILRGDDDPSRILATRGASALIPDMESAVFKETFEALFLMSAEAPEPIRAYLDSCAYCPSEAALDARLREIGARQLALDLETEVWESIRGDEGPLRFRVYLDNCRLCAFRGEAEDRIAAFAVAEEARAAESVAYAELAAARDLPGLRDWLEACTVCVQKAEAAALVTELEADGRYREESEALDAALGRRNAAEVANWLDTCQICDRSDEAQTALAAWQAEAAAAGPCLAAAGLPQQGGPRLLSEIDTAAARATCEAVLDNFPGNPTVATALGRVAQAEGDAAAADAAYVAGMAAGLPEAFGLAAHAAYAPIEGVADYAQAERLATEGYALGDWLSGEVLTVLYSRGLIEGKGPEQAFEIALAEAEAGNPVAQFFAGYFYRTGTGTDRSDVAATRWLTAAVDQGYLHANSFLAEIYEAGGVEVEAQPELAADLLWAALAGGDDTALDRLTDQIDDRPTAVVREVQTRLRDAGVFAGRIDGLPGPNTVDSVQRFLAQQVQVE